MSSKNKVIIIASIIVSVLLGVLVNIAYNNIKPSAIEEDIKIEATIKINDTSIHLHKDYIIDVTIEKNKESYVFVYPYMDGLGSITYSPEDEKQGYFVPGSIGGSGMIQSIVIDELKENNLIDDTTDLSVVGLSFPKEEENIKARLYINKLDSFEEMKNPVLVCVYSEKKFGKVLSWSKIVPVTVE